MKDHCDPAFLAYNSFAYGADRGAPRHAPIQLSLRCLLCLLRLVIFICVHFPPFSVTSFAQAVFG